jgi:predicted flap endonuclease-1-like 5' DNA nuclease
MGISRSNGTFVASLLWVAALFTAMNNIVASASLRDWLMSGFLLILGFILAFYPERLRGAAAEAEEVEGEIGDSQTRSDALAATAKPQPEELQGTVENVNVVPDSTLEETGELSGSPTDSISASEMKAVAVEPAEATPPASPTPPEPKPEAASAPIEENRYLAPAPTLEESRKLAHTANQRLSTAEMEAVEAEIGHTESRSDALAASAMPAPEELHGAMDNISTENSTLEDSGELSGPPTDSISRTALAAAPSRPDDLLVIDGIGPKMARALNKAGIDTFAKLAAANSDTLRAAIEAGGMRFAPTINTWPQQAAYAAKGDWDSLKSYIQSLKGGQKKG